ncbi:MFS transporter [Paraburkholderia sp. HD33-4]|uniref:MFS transporter n=1 Tax=Paraburkholderia sp. HD33-4 TaxID=2883242 RepID=UPI001F4856BB|nr:MFS transporter [Paraburkholderia sp. HD33-4]
MLISERQNTEPGDPDCNRAVQKAKWRLLPLLIVCYFVAYVDRSNIGVAALQMNKDLALTASMFGFGAGIFFLMYFSLEVPSNLLMVRYGVRRWIARIMFTWGLVAGAMAFVKGPISFYVMRALLGAAEAGFYPAVVYYLAQWFPTDSRGRVLGYLNVAGTLTFVIGTPLSSALLGLDNVLGLRGWQWMFIVEAVPAIVLSGLVLRVLSDKPTEARWLTKEESDSLTYRLETEERAVKRHAPDYTFKSAITSPQVLLLSFVMFNIALTVYTIGFFMPQIVGAFGRSNLQTGLISAIPFIAGSIGMLFNGWRSDVAQERYFHAAIPLLIAAVGLVGAGTTSDLTVKILAFCVVALGAYGCVPAFWSLPSTMMSGVAMAGCVAVVNSIGALGGFAGLWIMGVLKDATGSFSSGLYLLAGMDVLAALTVLTLRHLAAKKSMAMEASHRVDQFGEPREVRTVSSR